MLRTFIYFFALLLLSTVNTVLGQELRGKVVESIGTKQQPIAGATLRWLNLSTNHVSESDGTFTIPHADSLHILTVVHPDFETDSVHVHSRDPITIVLTRRHELETIEVTGEKPATYFAPLERKTEVITEKELEKAACCDLSACFGSNSSVQPEVTDVIADTKELQMLGIAGVYTQVLVDNIVGLINGINQNYGVSFIPGTLIDRIYVTKGANSVVQGYESISGLVNVLLKEGDESDRLFFNAYMNNYLEKQVNLNYAQPLGDWTMLLAGHSVQPARRVDEDGNSFLDLPRTTRYSLYNKWKYLDEEDGTAARIAWKITDEERLGGQYNFDPSRDFGTTSFYGQRIRNRRYEGYMKSEWMFDDETRLNVHVAAGSQQQHAIYGVTRYDALQRSIYADANYTLLPMEDNALILGAAYRSLHIDESVRFDQLPVPKTYAGDFESLESIPGLYAEDKQRLLDDQLTVIAGLRFDYHNTHGLVTTPRLFAKYDLDMLTSVRGSIGTGFRVPHVLSENTALLASSRDLHIAADLKPERALNYGVNITHLFDLVGMEGTLSLDLYRTTFQNQVVADYDSDVRAVSFQNLDGTSASNNLLAEVKLTPTTGMDFKIAYTFSDVYEMRNGVKKAIPFVSTHKALTTLSYSPPEASWQFAVTAEIHGPQSLPNTSAYPEQFRLPATSETFALINAQVSRQFDFLELYFGIENILGYTQRDPIIDARNPFSPNFEPTFIWAPVKGREMYAGIRVRFNDEGE